jgi:hypothetical protein
VVFVIGDGECVAARSFQTFLGKRALRGPTIKGRRRAKSKVGAFNEGSPTNELLNEWDQEEEPSSGPLVCVESGAGGPGSCVPPASKIQSARDRG